MASFEVYDHNKQVKETIELDDSVFASPVNEPFLHQVMVTYQNNQRQGTHKTKNRSEVNGTRSKPFRQKGTGRARQGTMHAPHHRHGARQFGPTPRSYRQELTKKMRQEAFRQSLSAQAERGAIHLLDHLQFEEIKTKHAAGLLEAFNIEGSILFLDVHPDDRTVLSIRNIQKTDIKPAAAVSPYDIFHNDHIVMTKAAAELFVQRYAKTKKSGGASAESASEAPSEGATES